jgi:hypothetical protein
MTGLAYHPWEPRPHLIVINSREIEAAPQRHKRALSLGEVPMRGMDVSVLTSRSAPNWNAKRPCLFGARVTLMLHQCELGESRIGTLW